MTISARRLAGRLSYPVLIAAAVPVFSLTLANLGGTGADARGIGRVETVRHPKGNPVPHVDVPSVQLAPSGPTQPIGELLVVRDPFAFAPHSVPPAPAPPEPVARTPQTPPDIPLSVPLSLIGIATTTRADGRAERTAIITAGPGDPLYMVREADAVTTRYRVDAVLPDGVVLVDGATGASLRLILR